MKKLQVVIIASGIAVGCATGSLIDAQPDGSTDGSSTQNDSNTTADGACTTGDTMCSGTCVDLSSDSKHCGNCSNACAAPLACVQGKCECTSPTIGCAGEGGTGDASLVCIDPQDDKNNCGSCGNACEDAGQNALPGCIDGGCGINSCLGGYGDCNKVASDGCESTLGSDKNNCGTCGLVCDAGAPACIDGGCVADSCGNNVIDTGERCDGTTGVPTGGQVSCRLPGSKNECKFDFSKVPQLYCNGSCSWAGPAGCDQADADIFCKLTMGSSTSTASSFTTATAEAVGGFSCPDGNHGTNYGTMPEYGVTVNVWYQNTSILANHGAGDIISGAVCTP